MCVGIREAGRIFGKGIFIFVKLIKCIAIMNSSSSRRPSVSISDNSLKLKKLNKLWIVKQTKRKYTKKFNKLKNKPKFMNF